MPVLVDDCINGALVDGIDMMMVTMPPSPLGSDDDEETTSLSMFVSFPGYSSLAFCDLWTHPVMVICSRLPVV
jgi:hypothetical protein